MFLFVSNYPSNHCLKTKGDFHIMDGYVDSRIKDRGKKADNLDFMGTLIGFDCNGTIEFSAF